MNRINNKKIYVLFAYLIKCNEEISLCKLEYVKKYVDNDNIYSDICNILIESDKSKLDIYSFDEALNNLCNEKNEAVRQLWNVMVYVCMLDGEIDKQEKTLLIRISERFDFLSCEFENSLEYPMVDLNVTDDKVINSFFYKVKKFLLSYIKRTIFSFSCISSVISKKIEQISCVRLLNTDKAYMGVACTIDESFGVNDNEFIESIKNNIMHYNDTMKKCCESDFSIAVAGRTMAGKSTYLNLVSGISQELIGEGAQRTTKYSTYYLENNVKIVDTPGLNAADDEGRLDEERTLRAVDNADTVFFIIRQDSVPEDTVAFLRKIAERNKHIYIILNYGDRNFITFEGEFKRFIKDKNKKWMKNKGKDRVEGYFGTILRDAKDKGYENQISFECINMLAASIGLYGNDTLDKYYHDKNIILKNEYVKRRILYVSNYDKAQNYIFSNIAKNAVIYRMNNIFQCWLSYYDNITDIFEQENEKYIETIDKLNKDKKDIISCLSNDIYRCIENIVEEICRRELNYNDKNNKKIMNASAAKTEKLLKKMLYDICSESEQKICEEIIKLVDKYELDINEYINENDKIKYDNNRQKNLVKEFDEDFKEFKKNDFLRYTIISGSLLNKVFDEIMMSKLGGIGSGVSIFVDGLFNTIKESIKPGMNKATIESEKSKIIDSLIARLKFDYKQLIDEGVIKIIIEKYDYQIEQMERKQKQINLYKENEVNKLMFENLDNLSKVYLEAVQENALFCFSKLISGKEKGRYVLQIYAKKATNKVVYDGWNCVEVCNIT